MDEKTSYNSLTICGYVAEKPRFSHFGGEKKYYIFTIAVPRLSGAEDKLNVICDENLLCSELPDDYNMIKIVGELRSHNNKSGIGSKLQIFVYAREVCFINEQPQNEIHLSGSLCKEPKVRVTPLGREICDLLIAVNRAYGHSDYIPCICWGQCARDSKQWEIGTPVELDGRVQSREYIKNVGEHPTLKTAYEVSASKIWRRA